MLLMVSGATTTAAQYADHPALGRLIQPRSWNRVDVVARSSMPWGADNDAITRAPREQFMFVAAPDAVERTPDDSASSWESTRWRWRCWHPTLMNGGLPAAIALRASFANVLQNGATPDSLPWDERSAVFVGASTRWKLSRSTELLVRMARARGLWVHVGRVNTMKRVARIEAMGADSFDGGQFSRWPQKYIPPFLARLEVRQHALTELSRSPA